MPDLPRVLSAQQSVQEAEYVFPYHYLDLEVPRERLINFATRRSRFQLVRDRLGDVSGLRILDAGCGDGRFCYEWRNSGADLVGVDYSARAIAFARAFVPEAEFHCADVADLEALEEFDHAVLIETLEHIPPEAVPKFLENLAKLIKPGGKLIVTVPSTLVPVGRKHYRHFDSQGLRQALEPVFDVAEIKGYGVLGDWRLPIRKRLAKMAFPLRKGPTLVANLVNRYADWYHRELGEGPPDRCRGLIATAVRR